MSDGLSDFMKNQASRAMDDPQIQGYIQGKVVDIMMGRAPVPCSYDDGDQSPLTGAEAQLLRSRWCTGMDNKMGLPYISNFHKSIYTGDYKYFLGELENKSGSEIQMMISKRETMLNISAIFQAIIGAKMGIVTIDENGKEIGKCDGHLKIVIKLISLGADVNVRDVAGYTPLHHCLNVYGNDVTFKMAERIVRAGAVIDARNRFGCTPLIDAGLANRYEFMEFLLQHGADQTLKDYDGYSTKELASMNPRKQKLLSKYYNKMVKQEKEELNLKPRCKNCQTEEGLKKCTGCYYVWFCSVDCQKKTWDDHKRECKEIQKEYKLCTFNKDWTTISMAGVRKGKVWKQYK